MTRLSVCGLGVSCNEMSDTPMLLVVMLYSINVVTHNYNAKDNTKSNWSTAYFHCGPCPNKMTSKFQE